MRYQVGLAACLVILGACKEKPATATANGKPVDRAAVSADSQRTNSPPPITPAHSSVIRKLGTEGMLRIPEVKAKSDELMKGIGKNGATIASQAIIFDKWLTDFAAANPAKVAEAKAAQQRAMKQDSTTRVKPRPDGAPRTRPDGPIKPGEGPTIP